MTDIIATLVARGVRRAWLNDSEFKSVEAGLQTPHCMCSLDLITLERRDIWLKPGMPCPFDMTAKDEIHIMWAADADILTFIAMDWPTPVNVLDPRVEWMRIDNGSDQFKPNSVEKKGHSLLDAARAYRVPAIPETVKKYWRDIAIRGGPFTTREKKGLLRYCRWDVDLTARVLMKMWDDLGLSDPRTFSQALINGRYMAAAARCYVTGIPLDMPQVKRLIRYAGAARLGLIEAQRDIFPVYTSSGSFNHKMFVALLRGHNKLREWPRTPTGRLSTSDETFEAMGRQWELARKLNEFRGVIDRLRAFDLPIGRDGRNRVSVRPFGTLSSRNNTAKGGGFIFAMHYAFRRLIKPPRG